MLRGVRNTGEDDENDEAGVDIDVVDVDVGVDKRAEAAGGEEKEDSPENEDEEEEEEDDDNDDDVTLDKSEQVLEVLRGFEEMVLGWKGLSNLDGGSNKGCCC